MGEQPVPTKVIKTPPALQQFLPPPNFHHFMDKLYLNIIVLCALVYCTTGVIIQTEELGAADNSNGSGVDNSTEIELYRKHKILHPDSNNRYQDITLNQPIPSILVKNQAHTIEGSVKEDRLLQYLISENGKNAQPRRYYMLNFVMVGREGAPNMTFRHEMMIGVRKFRVHLWVHLTGKFNLYAFIGEIAGPGATEIEVVEQSDYVRQLIVTRDGGLRAVNRIRPLGLAVQMEDNDLLVRWIPQTPLTKVRVYQSEGQQRIFIVSNDKGQLKLPQSQFVSFNPQLQTTIQISHAWSTSTSSYYQSSSFSRPQKKSINITHHQFLDHNYNMFKILSSSPLMLNVGDTFEIVGFCYEDAMGSVLVAEPSGKITDIVVGADGISAYSRFNVSFQVKEEGVYILEINHRLGYAVYNAPIYVGTRYPLIPANPLILDTAPVQEPKVSKQQALQQLLLQINQIRQAYNASAVGLDPKLSKLAQAHCQDMMARNYISHINPEKQNSKQRAVKAKIYTQIGENIIVDPRRSVLQYRLNRSPLHLRNTINKAWTRVGIAFMRNDDGDYYAVEEFSTEEIILTQQKLDAIKEEIVAAYAAKLQEEIVQNVELSGQLKKWFATYSLDNMGNLKEILIGFGVKSVSTVNISMPVGSNYGQDLKKNQGIKASGKKNFGIAMKSQKSLIKIIFLFY